MDISGAILRKVHLHHPVNSGKVNSTGCNIRAEQYCLLFFKKLIVYGSAFVLVLLAVKLNQVGYHFQRFQSLIRETNLLARAEENQTLGFDVGL